MENVEKRRLIYNLLFKYCVILLSVLSIIPLILILLYIFNKGLCALNIDFLINMPKPVGETGGGILNAILGSFIICFVSGIIAIPPALMAGIYLAENPERKISSIIRTFSELLQGIPSIVTGILAYIWIVSFTGWSALSGSVALSFMMLPVIVKSTEESVKRVPEILKEGALALGIPYYKVMLRVIIPTAFSGIISGIILSFARIAGETAPLIFTAFGSPYMETNILRPMSTLPHLIFNYAQSGYTDWIDQAWGAAFVLICIFLLSNLFVKWVRKYEK